MPDYRHALIAEGFCRNGRSHDRPATGRSICEECLQRKRDQRSRIAGERNAAGFCRQGCGRPLSSKTLCFECRRDARDASVRIRYGLSPEDYADLLVKQGGRCAICRTGACTTGKRFAVDHDHTCCPGMETCGNCIRGLLCNACNSLVGQIEAPSRNPLTPQALTYLTTKEAA